MSEYKINWWNFLRLWYMNLASIFAIFLKTPSWPTIIFLTTLAICSGFGITAGVHRCFSHKSFKANKTLKFLFIVFQTLSYQNSVLEWVKRHRMHHKFTDTCADPHSSKNGFWFAHCNWICYELHSDYEKLNWKVDMGDLKYDPWLKFQHKYYDVIAATINLLIPMYIGCEFFGENRMIMWHYNLLRIAIVCHASFCVNSVSHFYGTRPYDKAISAVESKLVSFITLGEGSHNYHHVFPFDYKSSESGSYWLNPTTALIDFFAWLGWAKDLRIMSRRDIRNRTLRTGDGSHPYSREIADLMLNSKLV